MSLSIDYENLEQASLRLAGTVVLYDGEPVYISDVREAGPGDPKGDIFRVYASPLPYNGARRDDTMRKFISSKKFDMAPFPMGFMNFNDGQVYYCNRAARRQQRQGLSSGTLTAVCVSCPGLPPQRFEYLISAPEFLSCIKGEYPTVPEATRMVEGGMQGVAFHRSFALVKDNDIPELIYLYHKKEKVGFIMEGRLMLSKKGKCLREVLNEAGVKC